jgi:membrane protein YqaA with SNARE-associated domain
MLFLLVLATCFVGGFLPLLNADLVLFGSAPFARPSHVWLLIILAVLAQVAGKLVFFGIARRASDGALRLLGRRAVRVRALPAARAGGAGAFLGIFVSASCGLPPLFLATFAAAVAGMPVLRFAAATLLGRFCRTAVLVLGPRLFLGGG